MYHKSNNPRLFTLDAMRGLAAIVVVIWHLPITRMGNGYLAVDFFFCLSGLVIAMAYEQRLLNSMSPRAFFRRRILRLYPLYVVGFLIGIAAAIGKMAFDLPGELGWLQLISGAIFNQLMLPSPVGWVPFPINGPSWSLFLELVINVAFCVAFVGFRTWSLVGVAVASAVGLLAAGAYHGNFDQGWNWATMPGGIARVLFSFSLGMLINRLITGRVFKQSWLALLPPALLMAVLLVPVPEQLQLAYGFVAICIFMPGFVLLGALCAAPACTHGACEVFGAISYPLYIVHRPLLVLGTIPAAFAVPGEIWMPTILLLSIWFSWILAIHADGFLRHQFARLFASVTAAKATRSLLNL